MRRIALFFFLLSRGLWDILRAVLWAVVVALCILGGLAFLDALSPPQLPEIRPLSPLEKRDSGRRIKTREALVGMDDAARWQEMQPALRTLDSVSPPIAEWVRGRYRGGHLVFETADRGRYAAWRVAPRVLIINVSALQEDDADLACTLAHEFRHARQPMRLYAQVGLAACLGLDRRRMIEDEAYEFEGRVRNAIGRP